MCPGIGRIHGDIAWGGNWFFLVGDHGQELSLERLEELTDFTWRIRQALEAQRNRRRGRPRDRSHRAFRTADGARRR